MKDIREDLKELQHLNEIDEDEELPDKRKYAFIGTIIIIILLITYFFFGPFQHIIVGLFRSELISDNTLETQGIRVTFRGNSLDKMSDVWYNNPEVENTLCLQGSKEENSYIIDHAYEPKIYGQSYTHVSHEACDSSTIIMFHTQPYKSCLASETDMRTLERAKKRNPDIVMIIMCEGKRFSVYR